MSIERTVSPEMIETLVLKFKDDLCEEENQSPLKIMKITSELAKLSCHPQTIQSFLSTPGSISIGSISFTLEEKNLFARLQILSNQVRKTYHFHEIPLYHLSPRLVLSSLEKKSYQSIASEQDSQKNSLQKKKNSKIKQSSKIKSNPPKGVQSPLCPPSDPIMTAIETNLLSEKEHSEDISLILSSRSQQIPVDEGIQTTFFREKLDPADLNGWVPVLNKKKDAMILSPKKNSTTKSSLLKNCPPSQQTSSPSKPKSRPQPLDGSSQIMTSSNISATLPPSCASSLDGCQNCISLQNALSLQEAKHSSDLQLLRCQYEEEIQSLRELHSQAIQSLQLKLFISNNNLEIEREERNKIIEEILSKYTKEHE